MHRPRLIANFAEDFGWHPIVLAVDAAYYEEPLDNDMLQLVRANVEVVHTKAWGIWNGPMRIGDIGIRSFTHLYKAALNICNTRTIDFIWIPIPSFYTALLGRLLYHKTKIPYGIDYIDPWVSKLAPYQKAFSKAWFSKQVAKFLEPIAVKKAALISGVSAEYFEPVLQRNFPNGKVLTASMPYGFDPKDHDIKVDGIETPWHNKGIDHKPFMYAGAFLPQSHTFIKALFNALSALVKQGQATTDIHFYFLGTGNYQGKSIMDYASEAGVSNYVTEIRQRFPFIHILHFLQKASGALIIGSTEKHYTASKTFQSLLSGKPVFAMMHEQSSAATVLKELAADTFLVKYEEGMDTETLNERTMTVLKIFIGLENAWQPILSNIEKYSSKASARILFNEVDKLV